MFHVYFTQSQVQRSCRAFLIPSPSLFAVCPCCSVFLRILTFTYTDCVCVRSCKKHKLPNSNKDWTACSKSSFFRYTYLVYTNCCSGHSKKSHHHAWHYYCWIDTVRSALFFEIHRGFIELEWLFANFVETRWKKILDTQNDLLRPIFIHRRSWFTG